MNSVAIGTNLRHSAIARKSPMVADTDSVDDDSLPSHVWGSDCREGDPSGAGDGAVDNDDDAPLWRPLRCAPPTATSLAAVR